MAAETSLEMINSVQSGLAVLATNCLTSFSISLNIRPWGDGSSRPGRTRSVLRPRSRALPIFLEGGAAADNAGCPRHPRRDASHDRWTKLYPRLAAAGLRRPCSGSNKIDILGRQLIARAEVCSFSRNLKPSDGDGPYRGRDGSRNTWSLPSPSKRHPIASSSSARMLNHGRCE